MTKPYSPFQSPEKLAEQYGGNKQKIAQAMQMGIVDATAGVLAGMFIDRMRGAQMQEGASPPTVAQQVMGGAPPAPAPPLPAGGLGGTSPAAPPMAPAPMGAPPMPDPGAPPVGMADGGLAMLPVPDAMFDEPNNGSYAGGGIVAFADGGSALGPWFEEQAVKALPGIRVTSRQRSPEKNRAVGGSPNSYHLTDNARDFVPPKGMSMGELAARLKATYGEGYDIINEGDHVHAEPGGKRRSRASSSAAQAAPERAANPISILDSVGKFRDVLTQNTTPSTQRREAMAAELEGAIDPEARKAERDSRRWEALAQFGFQLAQQPGSLLQAASAAASQILPTLRKGDEEMRAQLRADQAALVALEDKGNEEKQKVEMLALELAKAEAGLLSDERKMDLQYRIAQMDDATRRAVTAMTNTLQLTMSREQNASNEKVAGIRAEAAMANPAGIPGIPTTESGAASSQPDYSKFSAERVG